MTTDCYRFEERIFNDGLFSNQSKDGSAIGATYIIHLEGNGRLSKINEELNHVHPTNHVWILYNKGYRVKKKADYIANPAHDLVDCYIHIFQHANENKYENILILEDDYFFDDSIKNDVESITSISDFLGENKNTDFIYLLGCLPLLQIPIGEHRRSLTLGTHAGIYSQKCRDRVLLSDQKKIGDWDVWNNLHSKKYMFHRPICYQLFPQTENQKGWLSNYLPGFLQSICFLWIICPFFKFLALDREITPGYPFFYGFSEWVSIFIFVFLIYLSYKFFMTIHTKR